MALLPFHQVPQQAVTCSRMLGHALHVPAYQALGLIVALDVWAVEMAPEGDVSGTLPPGDPAVLVALAVGWEGDPSALLAALLAVGFLVREGEVIRYPYLKKYESVLSACWSRFRRREDPEPVLIPSIRIRMKTPEERAQAEAAHSRMLEETHQRHLREQEHRRQMKAAKRAAARVYFIQQDGGDGLVKIGTTTRPVEVRLKELQAGQPHPLAILAHAPGGRYEEGRLHDRFGLHRVTGEWFRPAPEILAYAATVGKAGIL